MESEETTETALGHASELYARLLEYATSPPFGERTAANVRRVTAMTEHHDGCTLCAHHQVGRVLALAAAQIVFDVPPLGMRLIDRYADWSAELTDQDRGLLGAWRTDDIHGVFEITRRAGSGVRVRCLGNDLEYTLHVDPKAAMPRADLRTGRFLAGHALPVGEFWMLAGSVELYAPGERKAMLGLMAELVRDAPALPFRNPVIVEQARAALAAQHQEFLRLFRGQGVARVGSALVEDLDQLWASSGTWDSWWPSLPLERDLCDLREALDQGRPDGGTWHPVHDLVHGLRILGTSYGMLADLHGSTSPISPVTVRQVSEVLDTGHVPGFALRDLAERHPVRAGEIYRAVLGRPGFTWAQEGAAWLRDRAGDATTHPGLVWMPGGAMPAGSGKPDRAIAVPHPLGVTFPPVPVPVPVPVPSGVTSDEY
ncbi:hypothetical protein [Promicromonospora panici]|uniref:hypothetical protein n=1 Tax=Promicromonospora panici TaxID=2219658 RepID=UPI00101E119A|nr:hypothetical protein [Promicromonospora panici]